MDSSLLALRTHGSGDGLPLVLLHGFPLDSRMWDDVVTHLAGEMTVITVDAPGFGESPGAEAVAAGLGRPAEPALETYADAVAASLRAAGIDRAVLAGLSMGGYAALALAERHRGLLAAVGLLDTKAEADTEEVRANRLAVAEAALTDGAAAVAGMTATLLSASTRATREDVVERVRAWLSEAPPAGIAWAQRAMAARPTRLTALEDLEVPGLVLRGAEDELSSQEAAEEMARRLNVAAELVVVPRAGHLSAVEDPAAVADALRRLHVQAGTHSG